MKKWRWWCAALVGLFSLSGVCRAQLERLDHFEFAEKPRLVECRQQPCFQIVVNSLDAAGQPVSLNVSAEKARSLFRVLEGGIREQPVFHVSYLRDRGYKGSYSMLLVDLSGSMNRAVPGTGQTRFQAAISAARKYIENLQANTDHMAIVPFESHNVISTIRDAVFYTRKQDLLDQLNHMPKPRVRNNTALYSAVFAGLSVLKPFKDQGYSVSLVVLTDGKNDVQPPPRGDDDPGLLTDRGAIEQFANQLGIQIITIGFGARGSAAFDEESLKRLAWPSASNYYYAGNSERLRAVFESAWKKLANRIQLTVGPVRTDKNQLSGQSLVFKVMFEDPSGRKVSSRNEKAWDSPALGAPAWEGHLSADELNDFITYTQAPSGSRRINTILWRLGILLIFGGTLSMLWFAFPRMIWPERYVRRPVVPSPRAPVMHAPRPPVHPQSVRPPSSGVHVPSRPPGDSKVTIMPKSQKRPASPPITPRKDAPPQPPRQASDETIYMPPDSSEGNDREG